jgi:hypothetical protein
VRTAPVSDVADGAPSATATAAVAANTKKIRVTEDLLSKMDGGGMLAAQVCETTPRGDN